MLDHYLFVPSLLLVPAIVGGVLHSVAIKAGVLEWLAIPIHRRWFGANKTYRGLVIMPLGCVVGVYLTATLELGLPPDIRTGLRGMQPAMQLICGLCLGLGYMVFELPNSYFKRRLGIAEGMLADGAERLWFLLADQVDSVIGCLAVCYLFLDQGIRVLTAALLLGVVAHLLVNFSLYLTGIRPRPV
ncbi:MAG TPA: CDP-archaeol synthase [Rhodanobacteraceae bacterium]|nr:CDP-archaeol synthase [Rhodanobacteraceae bacterium]